MCAGLGRHVPETLSRRNTGDRRGRNRRHHSTIEASGELDIALASSCRPSQLCDANLWAPNHCWRWSQKNIPWQRRMSWSWTISNRRDFYCSTRCIVCRNRSIICSSRRRLRPEIALAGSQLSTIANMVAASIGVSIVPQMMVKHYATPGCVSLPFAPPVPERELNFLSNPLRFQSKAAAAFRREARGCLVYEGFVDHSCSQGMIFLPHSFQRHRYQR